MNQNRDSVPQQFYGAGNVQATAINSDLTQQVTNPFYIGNFASFQSSNPQIYQYMSTTGFFTSKTIQKAQLLKPFPLMTGLSLRGNILAPLCSRFEHDRQLWIQL